MVNLIKKYMKGAVFVALLAPVFMAVEVMMDLMQPTLMSSIIDVGVQNGDIPYILDRGKIMLIVALVGVVGGAGCSIFSGIAGIKFGANLRQAIFDHIQTFSFKDIDRFSTSSLVTRLTNDVTQLQHMVMMVLRMLIRAPGFLIGGMIMAYMLSPTLSLIFVVAIPILLTGMIIIIRKAFPMFTQMQKKIDRVNTVMRENLLGVRVIKAFVGQEREKERFKEANHDLMSWSVKASSLTVLLHPIVSFVLHMAVIALFAIGGNMAIAGNLETGKIMAFLSYLMQVLHSLSMVVMLLMNFSRAKASSDRLNEVLNTSPSIAEPDSPRTPAGYDIEFENVSFRYNDDDSGYVLKDISFRAKQGQTIGIIGATGSGKTTLISLIPRLYDASEGAVRIGGVDVRDMSQDYLHGLIGVSLQESVLFAGTVRENLRWADESCDFEVIEQAARDAQAESFILANADGYDANVEQRAKNFSGGQKQRLSIARAFAKQPKILILDDSTSAVDTATEAKIRQAIARRDKDMIVFIIAQRVSAISSADVVLVLDEGRVSGIGTHEQMLKTNGIYRSIAVSQLGEEVIKDVG